MAAELTVATVSYWPARAAGLAVGEQRLNVRELSLNDSVPAIVRSAVDQAALCSSRPAAPPPVNRSLSQGLR